MFKKLNCFLIAAYVFAWPIQAVADTMKSSPSCEESHPDMVQLVEEGSYKAIFGIKGSPKHVVYKSTWREEDGLGKRLGAQTNIEKFYFDKFGSLVRKAKYYTNSGEVDDELEYLYEDGGRLSQEISRSGTQKGMKVTSRGVYSYVDDKNMIIKRSFDLEKGEDYWYSVKAIVDVDEANGDHTCYEISAHRSNGYASGVKYILSKDRGRYLVINSFLHVPFLASEEAEAAMSNVLNAYKNIAATSSSCPDGNGIVGSYIIKEKDGELDKFTKYLCSRFGEPYWLERNWQFEGEIVEYVSKNDKELADGQLQHHVKKYSGFDKHGNWTRLDYYQSTPATLTSKRALELSPSSHYVREIEYWEN